MLPLSSTPAGHQHGLSLVELMVAITLSLLLTLGVIQIFSSSKQTYQVQDALNRLQENARFALDFLTYDIRMAGNLGCDSSVNVSHHIADLPKVDAGIEAYDYNNLPDQIVLLAGGANLEDDDVVADTDVLIVKGAAGSGADLIDDMANATSTIVLNPAMAGDKFQAGELVMISDCLSAEIFSITSVSETGDPPSAINLEHGGLLKAYSPNVGAQVIPLNYAVYYVGTDGHDRQNLYRRFVTVNEDGDPWVRTEALVLGVDDFQITYGERLDDLSNDIRYVDPTAGGFDPERVIAVRFDLLMATRETNVATEAQSYWFGDQWITTTDGTDRRLFRSFRHTVQLRNRDLEL